jgi:hypothetical protein
MCAHACARVSHWRAKGAEDWAQRGEVLYSHVECRYVLTHG